MKKVYQPKAGAMYGPKDAQLLGQVLEKIGFKSKPFQLVDAARPVNSQIHHMFPWDDHAAAESWRRQLARSHINHLAIIIRTDEGDRPTRAYHSVVISTQDGDGNVENERAYCHMMNVAEDEGLSQQVIDKALAELNGWKARYAEYRNILIPGRAFKAIDVAARIIEKKTAKKPKRRKATA